MEAVRGVGFSSAYVEDIHFDRLRQNLDEAEELGVDSVELPLFGMDLIAGGRVIESQMRRLHDALKARSLAFTAHGPISVNFMQTPEIAARHLVYAKAAIEVAAGIGAQRLILHAGHTASQTEAGIEADYARQREAFAVVGDAAAERGIMIAVENIYVSWSNQLTPLPSRLAREIEAVGHPNVRACLDFSHAAMTSAKAGADFLAEAKALARVACHLHIHDSFGDSAQFWTFSRSERVALGLGDLHLPIGWGNIPWARLMAECTFLPDAVFNLELPAHYWYALKDSVAAVREMAATYRARMARSPASAAQPL
jgi:sugar phosphate isomerase/epimerase